MKISQLAKAAGIGVEAVRYYQRIGLLETPKRSSGFREYGHRELERLRFIRRAQALGFTLAEIATLLQLSAANCQDVEAIARERLASVAEKIADLQRIADVLTDVVARCAARESYEGCPIIETLTSH